MWVKLVNFIVIIQCVISRDTEDRNSVYVRPFVLNHGHQYQYVYFKYPLPNRHIVPQNPQVYSSFVTGQTGFREIRPVNFVPIPPNGFIHQQQIHHIVVPPNVINHNLNPVQILSPLPNTQALPEHDFLERPPLPIPLQIPDSDNKIIVENLHGKFEDFIRPGSNEPGQNTYGPHVRPHQGHNQGESQVHSTTGPGKSDFAPPITNKPGFNVPTVTTPLITNAQITTVTPPAHQQENEDYGDVQYDIDVRKDTT
ncbi:uncharacterized protein LOC114354819 [Ostrinia furnacalis]|uniref:uncharacterized protein LOC114354819 n=1 Tax=Ostrinia furnacalis TaxID=93504 RepID=UPI00103D4FC7|nr:uncharacterized protein LOC114354819 [Ostrinia furnacalis]